MSALEPYALSNDDYRLFQELIHRLTGITLAESKRSLVQGRLQKRLRYHRLEGFREYYRLLSRQGGSGKEITELINCITTNKTDFFREKHHFDFVRDRVVPDLVRQAACGQAARRIRVWHAGCSTGEEPYSLAITLEEALGASGVWDIRQLASDIDTHVLELAQQGVYEEERLAPIPEPLRHKHFLRGRDATSHLYRVRPALRERIVFRQINLLDASWPILPSVRFDMIFCRNVVIYFDKETQRRLFARFHDCLQPGGYLFIGHSESLLGISQAYESVGRTVYRRPMTASALTAAA